MKNGLRRISTLLPLTGLGTRRCGEMESQPSAGRGDFTRTSANAPGTSLYGSPDFKCLHMSDAASKHLTAIYLSALVNVSCLTQIEARSWRYVRCGQYDSQHGLSGYYPSSAPASAKGQLDATLHRDGGRTRAKLQPYDTASNRSCVHRAMGQSSQPRSALAGWWKTGTHGSRLALRRWT